MREKHICLKHIDYPEKTMYRMIDEIAGMYPKTTAYEFYDKPTSYQTFLLKVRRASRAFAAAGLKEGDSVTICLPNIPQAIDAFYALDRIGVIANMIHPLSAKSEITFYLNKGKSPYILTVDMFYENVRAAADEADHPVTVLVVRLQDELPPVKKLAYTAAKGREFKRFPNVKTDRLWSVFLKDGDSAPIPREVAFNKTRTSVILYSGGTSGIPKGICLSDYNMNCLGLQCREMIPFEFGPGLKMLSCMPMFHGFGLGVNIHAMLIHGLTCILMPSFNADSYANMLIKKKPNFIAGVPTIYDALLHLPKLKGQKLDFLMGMFCGGDSLPVDLKKRVDAFLKEHGATIQIQEGYGLTECVTASCLTPMDAYREGSIGLPYPDMKYAIVTPGTDDVLPPNTEGEIIISGPTVMLGYLDAPEETAQTLRKLPDGRIWMYTGDLGKMDEDGYVYFIQRIKRMIVTNGYNVYPTIIEDILTKHPGVSLCCLIGIKDERRGQKVVAYVVPTDPNADKKLLEDGIMAYLKEHVAAYALPKAIHFRSSLPKTLVGKVAYRKLEEEANAALEEELRSSEGSASAK